VSRSWRHRPERFHELSHGEGFLEILRTRINQAGFYLMDEPDAPLSFVSSLSLVALLHDLGLSSTSRPPDHLNHLPREPG
jgi:predicted ATPase